MILPVLLQGDWHLIDLLGVMSCFSMLVFVISLMLRRRTPAGRAGAPAVATGMLSLCVMICVFIIIISIYHDYYYPCYHNHYHY